MKKDRQITISHGEKCKKKEE